MGRDVPSAGDPRVLEQCRLGRSTRFCGLLCVIPVSVRPAVTRKLQTSGHKRGISLKAPAGRLHSLFLC